MKFLTSFFGVITKARLEDALTQVIAEQENRRNGLRRETFETLNTLDPKKDGERIQSLLTQMNSEVTASYEKEIAIRDFIKTANK